MLAVKGLQAREFTSTAFQPNGPWSYHIYEVQPPVWVFPPDSAMVFLGDPPSTPSSGRFYGNMVPVPLNNMADASDFYRRVTGQAPEWSVSGDLSSSYVRSVRGENPNAKTPRGDRPK
jgi:hypothetical protein